MEFFHKLKHWQLFMLLFVVPFIFYIIFVVTIISKAVISNSPEEIFSVFKFIPLIVFVPLLTLFGWLWSMGIGLAKYLPKNVVMNQRRFKILFFVPLIYLPTVMFMVIGLMSNLQKSMLTNEPPDFFLTPSFPILFFLFFVLHLFSVFCMFYCFYFAAKTYKSVILQREAVVSDYIGQFFMIWINVIGVWIMQPHINRITKGHLSGDDTSEVIDQV